MRSSVLLTKRDTLPRLLGQLLFGCEILGSVPAVVFGGLGTWNRFGLHETSHYIAPIFPWELPSGLNGNSRA